MVTVSHGQVEKNLRSLDFGICVGGPGCVFSEVVQEFIKSGGEDRWLSECQGQNSSFSVFNKQQWETPRRSCFCLHHHSYLARSPIKAHGKATLCQKCAAKSKKPSQQG